MPESNSLEWMLYIHKIRLSLIGMWIQNQKYKTSFISYSEEINKEDITIFTLEA